MATILLVDDVPLFLELETALLAESGHRLLTAGSGEEALELLQTTTPDLVLLDLFLPGIDGDEVCRRLRATETWADLPVIMVTAAGKESEVRRCLDAGCDDYLTKPISKHDLLEKIARLLDRVTGRTAPRVPARLRVQLKASRRSLTARARDISRNGIYVRSRDPLEVGSIVEVQVEFAEGEVVPLLGMVKRVAAGDEPGMGIYFIHPEPQGLESLERFVRRQSADSTGTATDPAEKNAVQLATADHRLEAENQALRARIEELEAENLEFAEKLVASEEINNNLTNLYVASSRLHSVLDRTEVIAIIQEVVINFVGAERFALLLWDKQRKALCFQAGEGFDGEAFPVVKPGEGLLGEVFVAGETYLHDGNVGQGSDDPLQPLAAIPLSIHDEVMGVLAIYHLFIQKEQFEAVDRQLFSMLAEQAATALFSANIYGESERQRQTYRGVMDLLLK